MMKSKLGAFLGVLVLAGSLGLSVTALTTSAEAANCEGLGCNTGSDCGTKCFCNGPSGSCILDNKY
jgi:hypothetical protein